MVRIKYRYVLVEFQFEGHKILPFLKTTDILKDLKNAIKEFFGDLYLAKLSNSLQIKYFNPATNICIIRVGRDLQQILYQTLFFLTKIEGYLCRARTIKVSGTLDRIEKGMKEMSFEWLLANKDKQIPVK